jgi:hypothetical protein
MADVSKLGEKGKDIFVALERLTQELPITRTLIVFLLFCDCFIFIATGRSFLNLEWGTGKEITLGGVFLCIAAFSFAMMVIAPLCLQLVLWIWFTFGANLVLEIKSHLPHREEERRPEREEQSPDSKRWIEPPSYLETQLQRNLVSLPKLYEHALNEQSPLVLELVEERENELQAELSGFEESTRTASWSVMVVLLTVIDLYLGSKAKSTVLWVIVEKLKQYSPAGWIVGSAYLFAAIWPLIEFIKTDLDEWHESRTKPVFYPPLARKLLSGVQQERREKEMSMQAFLEGWRDARPPQVAYAPRADASTALQIAERLQALIDYFGRAKYCLKPAVPPARAAKLLGYDSVTTLEAVFSGTRPLPFAEAELICETFGVNAKWLLDGESSPFKQTRLYSDCHDFFRALVLNQLTWGNQQPYYKLLFILALGEYEPTLVYGQRDDSAYRFDLLLDNVPIYAGSDSSRTGLFHFCLAAAEICRTHYFSTRGRDYLYSILDEVSYIPKTDGQYQQIVDGHVHLSWVVRELPTSNWVQDIWDLEFTRTQGSIYGQNIADSYRDFVGQAERMGITNNEELHKYIDEKKAEILRHYRRQTGTQESTVDA